MFWILVSLLTLIAIALLTFPLWRRPRPAAPEQGVDALNVLRDQRNELDEEVAAGRLTEAEREARIAELTRRVHDEGLTELVVPAADGQPRRRPWLAAAVAVLVPAIALPVYFIIGTPAALDPAARAPGGANSPHGDFTPEQVRELLDKLKARLEANPTDINGWVILGRGRQLLNEFPASAAAFAKASALKPDDPGLLADYADALAMAQNRTLKGKPWELVQQALQIDPRLPKALALAATAEYDEGRFASAKGYWQRLLAVLPPDSEDANEIRTLIAQVDGMPAGAAPRPAAAPPPGSGGSGSAGQPAITGTAGRRPQAARQRPITGPVQARPPALATMAAPAGDPNASRVRLARAGARARGPSRCCRDAAVGQAAASFGRRPNCPGRRHARHDRRAALSATPQVRIEARVSRTGEATPKARRPARRERGRRSRRHERGNRHRSRRALTDGWRGIRAGRTLRRLGTAHTDAAAASC
ncbi:MAG: c-type cytochrome biogenesis protein CcmI [Betaproteobacteria bacterium]|nr:c-type cytochrome biogenesis protein CcmI [Betaproteobacteria bacterium]